MRTPDPKRRYRSVAMYIVTHGRKMNGRTPVTWEELRNYIGEYWESYTHELVVKGIINSSSGYVYLTDTWANMTPAEQMEQIQNIYPYPR